MDKLKRLAMAIMNIGFEKEPEEVFALIRLAKYKEGKDSTFSSGGKEYSVDLMIERSESIKTKKVAVKSLKWILKYDNPEENRIRKADIKVPILIIKYGKKLLVVDGLHRLAKAIEDGLEYLPAKLLSKKDMAASEIK